MRKTPLPALAGFVIEEIVAEAQSAVDDFSGPRNHDLVVHGRLPNGERVVVCIEAKAGEDFGPTVAQQQRAAAKAVAKAQRETAKTGTLKTSNAEARLHCLLQRFVPHPATEPRVEQLRYQLLTALAGTISAAEDCDAPHAVLMVHEFLTDGTRRRAHHREAHPRPAEFLHDRLRCRAADCR